MALNLDAALQAQMNGIERTPIIELISSQFIEDIPFEGQYMNDLQTTEGGSSLSLDTTNRIIGTIIRGGTIYFIYSDSERQQLFEKVVSSAHAGRTDANVVSLLDDNNNAIIYTYGYDIYRVVVDATGQHVQSSLRIYDFTNSNWTSTPYAIRLQDATYLMAVTYRNSSNSNYYLMTFTSSNFSTWTSNGNIALSGLDPTLQLNYPSLVQALNGDIILAFDYVEEWLSAEQVRSNIYTITSTDNGNTWGDPVRITNYNDFGTIAYHPDLTRNPDGSITLAYTEKKNVLTMNKNTLNYQYSPYVFCTGNPFSVAEVQFDAANNKLYLLCIYTYVGTKVLCSIVVVDVPTWTIDRCYTTQTVPGYHPIFAQEHVWWDRWISTGDHTVVGLYGDLVFMVVHHDTNEIITYVINDDIPAYLLTANLSIDFGGYTGGASLQAGWLDSSSGRLYLYFQNNYYYTHAMWLGYINIHAPATPTGQYSYTPIVTAERMLSESDLRGFHYMHVVPEMDYIILGFERAAGNWRGHCIIYQISSGALLKHYNWDDNQGFPQPGIAYPIYYNGHIYGDTPYQVDYNHQDRRGLMDINLATDEIQYITPSFATADNYGLDRKKVLSNGRILMDSAYGPCIYDTRNGTWELFSTTTLPGLPTNAFASFDYDPLTGTIFAASPYYPLEAGSSVLAAWNEHGAFLQGNYFTATKDEQWNYGTATQLVRNWFDYENSVVMDPDGSLWTLWTRRDLTEYSIKWDKSGATLNLTDYLTRDSAVQLEWHIDSVNSLQFKLSHGHLFDPLNTMSALSRFVVKGRRITVYIGEIIEGVTYLQIQGEFLVMATEVKYQRGEYPAISVQCEDYRTIWEDNTIVATPYYEALYPETIITNLLTIHGGLEESQINLPTLTHRHTMICQFLDVNLRDCLKDILDHFQAFDLVDVDGRFIIREINLDSTVHHTYTDSKQVIHISPDDSFSNFINRVVVKGEGNYHIEILYGHETVATLSGTTGWWGKKEKIKVWYSEDHQRTCRDPILTILESVKDFKFFVLKGGGGEEISAVDINEQWVEVKIDSPNLVGVAIGLAAAIVAVGTKSLSCTVTCGPYIFALSILTNAMAYLLGAVASYSYEISARPIGHVKQTFQTEANDLEFQRYLNGQIITEEIDDPFCYTVASCQRIADYELSIVQAQRKRLTVEKITHLQDQIGDIIRVIHPYSQTSLKMFITDLVRTYNMPKAPGGQGGITDQLSGWRLLSS